LQFFCTRGEVDGYCAPEAMAVDEAADRVGLAAYQFIQGKQCVMVSRLLGRQKLG